ncbi:MAG: hypothetical protein ABII97_01825 [Patescibacteria group bacterium]
MTIFSSFSGSSEEIKTRGKINEGIKITRLKATLGQLYLEIGELKKKIVEAKQTEDFSGEATISKDLKRKRKRALKLCEKILKATQKDEET